MTGVTAQEVARAILTGLSLAWATLAALGCAVLTRIFPLDEAGGLFVLAVAWAVPLAAVLAPALAYRREGWASLLPFVAVPVTTGLAYALAKYMGI